MLRGAVDPHATGGEPGTPPQTFPARPPRRSRRKKQPGGGEVELRVPSEWGAGGKPASPAIWRRKGGFSAGRGLDPTLLPTNCRISPHPPHPHPGPVGAGPARALPGGAHRREPSEGRAAPGAMPTHRALAAGTTDGLGREARPRGCLEALSWDCAPSLLLPLGGAEPPPHVPLCLRSRLPGA